MAARVWPVDAVAGSPSNTGRSLRQTIVSPVAAQATGTRPLGGVSGVRPGTPTTIVTTTSTTWTVTPFLGLIDGEAAAIAGVYSYSFDTNQTGSVTAAAGSARIDRLDVQVSDPAESDGSSTPGIAIVYTAGTPGSGVPAAAPARSHALALINVPASGGGSPTVSWNAAYYAAPGGYVPFNTLAGLQAWTTASTGQHATVINDSTTANNGDYVYTGSAWVASTVANQTWTPTIGNVTTSAIVGRYSVASGVVVSEGKFTVSAAPTAPPTITLPIAAYTGGVAIVGSAVMRHIASGAFVECFAELISSTGVQFFPKFTSGSPAYVQLGLTVNSGNPFTWASGDTVEWQIRYSTF